MLIGLTLVGAASGGGGGWLLARYYDHLFIVRALSPAQCIFWGTGIGAFLGLLLGRIILRSLAAAYAFDVVEYNREELRHELKQTKARLEARRREATDPEQAKPDGNN